MTGRAEDGALETLADTTGDPVVISLPTMGATSRDPRCIWTLGDDEVSVGLSLP